MINNDTTLQLGECSNGSVRVAAFIVQVRNARWEISRTGGKTARLPPQVVFEAILTHAKKMVSTGNGIAYGKLEEDTPYARRRRVRSSKRQSRFRRIDNQRWAHISLLAGAHGSQTKNASAHAVAGGETSGG